MTIAMYLKIPGVQGGSKAVGYTGAIEVLAFSWGMSNTGSAVSGPDKSMWQDISMTAYQDTAASPLMLSAMSGTRYEGMTLSVVNSADKAPVDKYLMSNAFVASVSCGGSGGEDQLTLNYTFAFSAVTCTIDNRHWHWDMTTNTGGT